jgi:DmsE family decaheme c-type cytochrome
MQRRSAVVLSCLALLLGTSTQLSAQQQAGKHSEQSGYVGVAACTECHQKNADAITRSLHGKIADKGTPMAAQGCETCHGPGSKHADDPDNPITVRFTKASPEVATAVCTSCHASSEHGLWAGSKHEARGVTCTSCHSVHNPKGIKQLKAETQPQLCASCHRNVVNKLTRFNHMPVREDKLVCSSCHNPHGSANVKLLRAGTTVDEACTSCHSEKRGPFLWEHAPVSNSCTTCHDSHGTSNERMLVTKVPFLCQRCHVTSRHPPTVYNGYTIATTSNANKLTGRGCIICHAQIHGSNSPNGKALLR